MRRTAATSAIAASLSWLASNVALATESAATNKALGVDTVLAGYMPPPGMRLTTFFTYYTADQTLDSSGNPRPNISNFDLNVTAVTVRLQYVWPDIKLWGANIETRFGLNLFADVDLDFDVQTPGGKLHRSGSATGPFAAGLFAPALLGWHGETFHQIAGFEVFFPGTVYDKNDLVNLSTNFWSLAPAYWFTWLPNDDIEVSASLVYLFNLKNPATNYKSGQEISIDYGLGYGVTPAWQLGLSGYLYKQVTDDEVNGNSVPGGNRGQAVAVGPFIRYHPSRDWGITFKWQHEYLVENRPSGNRFFLQFALKLW